MDTACVPGEVRAEAHETAVHEAAEGLAFRQERLALGLL
jgi:hypothetical protein